MKRNYRVVLLNSAERPPIIEVVLAENREHALNHILTIHNVRANQFTTVIVELWTLEAPSEHNHNKSRFKFDENNHLIEYEEVQANSDFIVRYTDKDGVQNYINFGDSRTFVDVALRCEGK